MARLTGKSYWCGGGVLAIVAGRAPINRDYWSNFADNPIIPGLPINPNKPTIIPFNPDGDVTSDVSTISGYGHPVYGYAVSYRTS